MNYWLLLKIMLPRLKKILKKVDKEVERIRETIETVKQEKTEIGSIIT